MNNPHKMANYGLIIEPTEIDHYVFGGSSVQQDILQADGQWDNFLPDKEIQNRNGIDVYNCTAFGTVNCIEILMKKIYNI